MQVLYNGNDVFIPLQRLTLSEFVKLNNLEQTKGIAIAINEQVVNRSNWTLHEINNGDKILVIKAAQGG